MNVSLRTLAFAVASLVLALRTALAAEQAAPPAPASAVETKSDVVVVAEAAAAQQRAASAPLGVASERATPAPSVDWRHAPRRTLTARRR
jgi:hypothetical protein